MRRDDNFEMNLNEKEKLGKYMILVDVQVNIQESSSEVLSLDVESGFEGGKNLKKKKK